MKDKKSFGLIGNIGHIAFGMPMPNVHAEIIANEGTKRYELIAKVTHMTPCKFSDINEKLKGVRTAQIRQLIKDSSEIGFDDAVKKYQVNDRNIEEISTLLRSADIDFTVDQIKYSIGKHGFEFVRALAVANLESTPFSKIPLKELRMFETSEQLKKRTWKDRIKSYSRQNY